MNTDLMSHQQLSHIGIGPQFKASSENKEKQGTNLAIHGLIV